MKRGGLGEAIYRAVDAGRLNEPFDPCMVARAVPGWAPSTYPAFLPKHRVGNPMGTTELFIRTSRGTYRTRPDRNRPEATAR